MSDVGDVGRASDEGDVSDMGRVSDGSDGIRGKSSAILTSSLSAPPSLTSTPPHWITRDSLEQQLARVHGSAIDPNVGLFGPESMMWRVGRAYLPSVLGSGRALLLQIAHPWVTQGVDQHSTTRTDPIGRARRTFISILSMTFGSQAQALAAARALYNRHARVQGTMGYDAGAFARDSVYRANEANALLWVHATLWDSAMRMYELVVEPLSEPDKERYYQETKLFAYLFGIPESALPANWPTFIAYNEHMWNSDQLAVTPATLELTRFLFRPLTPLLGPAMKWGEMITAATLPQRLREEFQLAYTTQTPLDFERTVRRFRTLHRRLPDRLRYSPAYFEALARIQGHRSDLFTRLCTRAALGRWRLVS